MTDKTINIFVTISVPEANRPEILKLLEKLTVASQAENGNQHYQYYLHPTDPTQLVIVEQWANAEVLDAHENTEHFKTLLPKIGDMAASVDIRKF